MCNRGDRQLYIVNDPNDENDPSPTCAPVLETQIARAGIKLGYFHPLIYDEAVLALDCHQLNIFHNGNELADFGIDESVDTQEEAVAATLERSDWNGLPLLSADVIAFRFKNATRSCYSGISELSVNGTTFSTTDSSKAIHTVSFNFEEDWMTQNFIESANFTTVTQTGYIPSQARTNYYYRIAIL